MLRSWAMTVLGGGLQDAKQDEDALSVYEAELSMMRRHGAQEGLILVVQGNLACSYEKFGQHDQALRMRLGVYSGRLRLHGEQHQKTLLAVSNYAATLLHLKRFQEARSLLRKTMPTARRVLGESNDTTLRMKSNYAVALYRDAWDAGAALDDLREAVTMLEETEPTARRVFGGAHPTTTEIERCLRESRAALAAREDNLESLREAMEAMASSTPNAFAAAEK